MFGWRLVVPLHELSHPEEPLQQQQLHQPDASPPHTTNAVHSVSQNDHAAVHEKDAPPCVESLTEKENTHDGANTANGTVLEQEDEKETTIESPA